MAERKFGHVIVVGVDGAGSFPLLANIVNLRKSKKNMHKNQL